jgi:antitoxin component YwqK of YwqJK toxin-antitoxin module
MKYLLLLLYITFTLNLQAQKKQNIYYVNASEKFVADLDSALYIRIIQEPDSGSNLYSLKEFYKNKKIKRVGMVFKFEPIPFFEGSVISFFENGKKKSIENFKNERLLGFYYSYYPNGNLKEHREYVEKPQINKYGEYLPYKIIQIADSLGNKYLDEDATGTFKLELDNGNVEEGSYVKGEKNGTWTYFIKKLKETYIEEYKVGKFLSGKTIDKNNHIYEYKERQTKPYYIGGDVAFSNYLNRELKNSSKILNLFSDENLVFNFYVNEDNSISDLRINKSFSQDVADEVFMILKKSKWVCAKERGKPVSRRVILPVNIMVN